MGKSKADWSRIRQGYVNSTVALTKQSIADKCGVRLETVVRRATKEKWDIERERFLARVDEQTTEKKSELVASEGASFDATCLDYAHRILTLVDDELAGQIVLDKLGNQVHIQRPAKDIATAVRIAQDVGKLALGDKPDPTVKVDLSKASISDLTSALTLVEKLKGQT